METSTSVICVLGAVVNFSCAAGFFVRSRWRIRNWARATGRIRETVSQGVDGGETPIVEFRDGDGLQQEFKNFIGGSNWYHAGTRVDVLYDPDQPDRAQINDWTSLWAITVIGLGTGSLFILFSFFMT